MPNVGQIGGALGEDKEGFLERWHSGVSVQSTEKLKGPETQSQITDSFLNLDLLIFG